MSPFRPRKPSKAGARLSVWEMLFNGKFPFVNTNSVKWRTIGNGYGADVIFPSSSSIKSGGWDWMYPTHKEGDPTQTYSADTFMFLSANNPLVTTGLIDAVSGLNVKALPGFWQAAKNVPAQVVVAGVTKWNVPVFPYPGATGTPSGSPLKGDLDGGGLFWIYFGQIVC